MTSDLSAQFDIVPGSQTKKAIKQAEQFSTTIENADAATNALNKGLLDFDNVAEKAFNTFENSANNAESAIESLTDATERNLLALDEMAESGQRAVTRRSPAGGAGGAGGDGIDLGATASRQAQARGALEALGIGDGLSQILEIGEAVADLGEIAQVAQGTTKGLTAAETAESTAAAGATVTMTGLTAALGVVAVAGAALVAGFALLSSAKNDATERAKKLEEVYRATAESSAALERTLQTGGIDDAIAQYQQLLEEQAVAQLKANDAAQRANELIEQESVQINENWQERLKDVFDVTDLDQQANQAKKTQEEYAQELDTVNSKVEEAGNLLTQYGVDISDIPTAKAAEQERELTAERERASDAIDSLEAQEQDLVASRQQALDDLEQDRSIRNRREQEDFRDQQAKLSEQRAKQARQDSKKLADIRRDSASALRKISVDGNKEILDITKDGNDARVKLQVDADNKAIEAQNQFNIKQAQAEQQFRLDQFNAVLDNNIVAALQQERAFELQQRQEREQLEAEKQQRETEKQQRLQELREEQQLRITEVKANIQQELAAQRQASQERVAAERAAIQERLAEQQKADRDAEKERAKRERRRREDEALQDERSQRAFDEQLSRIEKQKQAEQQALQATFDTLSASGQATIDAIAQSGQAAVQATGQIAQQVVNSLVNATGGSSTPSRAFQHGGIITEPTIALMGEGRLPEAVIPFEPSEGLPTGFGGQPQNIININLTTSDIVTVNRMAATLRGAFTDFGQVNIRMLENAVEGMK